MWKDVKIHNYAKGPVRGGPLKPPRMLFLCSPHMMCSSSWLVVPALFLFAKGRIELERLQMIQTYC